MVSSSATLDYLPKIYYLVERIIIDFFHQCNLSSLIEKGKKIYNNKNHTTPISK